MLDGKINRREFLNTAATTASVSALAGRSFATSSDGYWERLREVRKEYNSPEEVENIINRYSLLLERLHNDGHLQSSDINISNLDNSCDYIEKKDSARVWGLFHPGTIEPTAHITVRRETPSGQILALAITPEVSDRANAVIKPPGKISEEGEDYIRYRSSSPEDPPKKFFKRYIPKKAGELNISDLNSRGISTEDIATYTCSNTGDEDSYCGSAECYGYEVECTGDSSCDLIDCTGNKCCGGCCCCEDISYCCEICGDMTCESDPCSWDGTCVDCLMGGCCSGDSEGCGDPNCSQYC